MQELSIALLLAMVVAILVFALLHLVLTRRDRSRHIAAELDLYLHPPRPPEVPLPAAAGDEPRFDVLAQQSDAQDLDTRLLRAGFVGLGAAGRFRLIRALAALGAAGLAALALLLGREVPLALVGLIALMAAGTVYVAAAVVIDQLARSNQMRFRKMFPDLLDLLIVCVDAGLGVEAAVDRVAEEFVRSRTLFGQYVLLMSLEMRAGRQIDEALQGFARRTGVQQAAELAVLFRQSQELGTSIVGALRAFSQQMRQMRMIRAEETANQLPVRMLVPLAGFLFPVNLMIVLVPVMIHIFSMFIELAPARP